eukprot:scaffold102359_cov18-Prasinocladus_malaysianus.AAC.1
MEQGKTKSWPCAGQSADSDGDASPSTYADSISLQRTILRTGWTQGLSRLFTKSSTILIIRSLLLHDWQAEGWLQQSRPNLAGYLYTSDDATRDYYVSILAMHNIVPHIYKCGLCVLYTLSAAGAPTILPAG